MAKIQNEAKWGKATAKERYGTAQGRLDNNPEANNLQAPQDIQDKHLPGYANDSDGWVRGKGKNAPYPHFDKNREGKN